MPAILGDCLSVAERFFTAAEAGGPPVRDHAEFAIQTRRLVTVLGRYLDTVTGPGAGQAPAAWQQAAAGLRTELRAAGSYLDRVLPPADHLLWSAEVPADPAVARYARAVDALAAGNDLLRTHTAPGATGTAVPRSDWAQILATEPVAAGLTAEIVRWAARAGRMIDRLARASDLPKPALAAARGRLDVAARAGRGRWAAGARRDLLHGIPAALSPERIIPAGVESDADLCAGIAVSAQRLRMAAFTIAREPGSSPALSGPAWRRTSHASAIICDLAVQVLRSLACHPGAVEWRQEHLREAASSFTTAREAWRHATRMWQFITTDTTSPASRTTADLTDLVLRLGRLASGDPGWTPASARKAPRAPDSMGPRILAPALGAVHEAADAVTRMACADLTALGAVGRAGRLYMPAKIFEKTQSRHPYVAAPGDRVNILKNAFYLGADTTWRAASALDGPVMKANAPSRMLAMIRAVLPETDHVMDPETGFVVDPDLFARQTAVLTRPWKAWGRRREHIEPGTIINAYEREKLSLKECGERFSVSADLVEGILIEHGHPIRKRGARPRARSTPPVPPPDPPSEVDRNAPVYRQLRTLGINDPGLLDRAAMIDRAAADVLKSAAQHRAASSPAPDTGTALRNRSPADLAAKDGPQDATPAVRRAATHRTSPHQRPASLPDRASDTSRPRGPRT
jgi:hypothetical protein